MMLTFSQQTSKANTQAPTMTVSSTASIHSSPSAQEYMLNDPLFDEEEQVKYNQRRHRKLLVVDTTTPPSSPSPRDDYYSEPSTPEGTVTRTAALAPHFEIPEIAPHKFYFNVDPLTDNHKQFIQFAMGVTHHLRVSPSIGSGPYQQVYEHLEKNYNDKPEESPLYGIALTQFELEHPDPNSPEYVDYFARFRSVFPPYLPAALVDHNAMLGTVALIDIHLLKNSLVHNYCIVNVNIL
jgi:hypothetical protein